MTKLSTLFDYYNFMVLRVMTNDLHLFHFLRNYPQYFFFILLKGSKPKNFSSFSSKASFQRSPCKKIVQKLGSRRYKTLAFFHKIQRKTAAPTTVYQALFTLDFCLLRMRKGTVAISDFVCPRNSVFGGVSHCHLHPMHNVNIWL